MLLSLRPKKSKDGQKVLIDKKVSGKFFRENLLSKVTKGFHISKKGRILEFNFVTNIDEICGTAFHLSFTEAEVFQMAKWCRRGRSDEEFLEAIMKHD